MNIAITKMMESKKIYELINPIPKIHNNYLLL